MQYKKICLLNPQKNFSAKLAPLAHIKKQVRRGVLELNQFPPILNDNRGSFTKPTGW